MGMFDSVYAECPWCNNRTEMQSKSGRCQLDRYDLEGAPTKVMAGIELYHTCDHCKKCFLLEELERPVFKARKPTENDEFWKEHEGACD